MSDYKPTDAEVRHEYVMSFLVEYQQDASDEFDRWLAEHDAKVRAETLREARDNVRASSFWADGSDNYADRVRGYLSRAADRIEKEAGL